MVLGLPWLKEYNPDINWQTEEISFIEEGIKGTVSEEGPLNHDMMSKPNARSAGTIREKESHVDTPPILTEYQQELERARKVLPTKLHDFLGVFAQKEYRLPDHGKNDLAIKLRKGAVLPKMKQRRYTREDSLEIKKQLKELLEKGKVRHSRSESAVRTLFIPKADG